MPIADSYAAICPGSSRVPCCSTLTQGIEAIRAFRASVGRYAPRAIRKVHITAFGPDMACTHLEYQRTDSGLVGRETKIMARLPGLGFKVVSAHVSLLAEADPGRVAKA